MSHNPIKDEFRPGLSWKDQIAMQEVATVFVTIGRYQPFHRGHWEIIDSFIQNSNRTSGKCTDILLILVGSANTPRSVRNPFTFEERHDMILETIPREYQDQVRILPLNDMAYNDTGWIAQVQQIVYGYAGDEKEICLIGHSKDSSSYYLKMFPDWHAIDVPAFLGNDQIRIDATTIRNIYFAEDGYIAPEIGAMMPTPTVRFLKEFRGQNYEIFKMISDEAEHVKMYRKQWETAPYPPTFVTVDAVVVQSGHILMVERGDHPGKGLMALPGGFVSQDERLVDAMLRELREETSIKLSEETLRRCITKQGVFDDPTRSMRGRTITHAYLIELRPETRLPKIKGGDDAAKAFWVPLGELNARGCFEDHYAIIQSLLGIAGQGEK